MTNKTPDKSTSSATFQDRLANLALKMLLGVAAILPYRFRVPFFGILVSYGVAPLAGYAARAQEQLALIFPDMELLTRRAIARKVCDNFGRTFIENYSARGFARMVAQSTLHGDGLDALSKAREEGRPVLFVTGHFGNHEAPRLALTQQGYAIGGLYRPMKNAFIEAHYKTTMTEMSGPVFAQGKRGMIGFVRMLRDGGLGTLLFDVRATAFPRTPFLGRPAHTATSAAEIALRVKAVVIPYFAKRMEDGLRFDIEIGAPIEEGTVEQMMAEMTARLEAKIMDAPEQWFWVHRRWD